MDNKDLLANGKSDSEFSKNDLLPPPLDQNAMSNDEDCDLIDNKGMFRRVFSFKGRIRRLEYNLSYIILYVCSYLLGMILDAIEEPNGSPVLFNLLIIIYVVASYWFWLAQSAKRCHDRGNSGWYQLIPFYNLVLMFGNGDEGENDYGTDPKE